MDSHSFLHQHRIDHYREKMDDQLPGIVLTERGVTLIE